MNFSKRTQWDLEQNLLTKLLKEKKAAKASILDLTESNPTKCGFHYPMEDISRALINQNIFSYKPHPKGLIEARIAVASYYLNQKIDIDPEQLFLTSGTSEAYSFIFCLITNPEDSILVPRPSYPLFDFLADINDVELHSYSLIYDQGWHIDFDSIKQSLSTKTKAILVVHPNNPTGSYVKNEEMLQLIEIAEQNGLALISDEVFFDYGFQDSSPSPFLPRHPDKEPFHGGKGTKRESFAGTSEVLTFTLNGLSKIAGLPQMKLAWIIANGPSQILQEAIQRLEIIADTFLSVNTPVQQALPEILRSAEGIQNQIKNRVFINRQCLQKTIHDFPSCEYLESEGGWYAILRVPKIKNDEEWALALLEQECVYIHPGHFYNFDLEGYLVASLLVKPRIFQEGMKRILSYFAHT